VETTPAVSLLNALVREGVRIRHDCGGKALCGTCRVRVVAGEGALSPVGERERTRLEAIGVGQGMRLACQTHAFRDAEIEIPEDS
jgi:ferredoxin